jgi:hypothetical protein
MQIVNCELCGHELEMLLHPVRRLRWTRHWLKGIASLFTRALRICPQCGAMYSGDGELMAMGAVQTETEKTLDTFRRDMAHLRDSFGGVIVAGELAAVWLLAGLETANVAAAVLAASIGAGAVIPFALFGSKAREARKRLKRMKQERLRGQVPRALEH